MDAPDIHFDERHADAQVQVTADAYELLEQEAKRSGFVPDELAEERVLADLAAATD